MTTTSKSKSWRDVLPVHPAAELFPMMEGAPFEALVEDVRQHDLRTPMTIWEDVSTGTQSLLDGRNRLRALIASGRELHDYYFHVVGHCESTRDPYAYVLSANIHRRHLTADQKRDLIAAVIMATPTKSDRQIADEIKSNRNTVGRVRAKLEQTGDVSLSDTRTDSKGRQQPAHKPPPKAEPCAPDPEQDPVADIRERVEQAMDEIVAEVEAYPVISQCVADVRERIEMTLDEIARNEWSALTERLYEAINDIIDQRYRAHWRATHQPDEMPDIPDHSRRSS